MHVTGIATGNPSQPVGGELIYGVAPEAQVMFMRVFSDIHNRTGQALIMVWLVAHQLLGMLF